MSATGEWAARLEVHPRDVARGLHHIFRVLVEARGALATLEAASAFLPVRPSNMWNDIDALADAIYEALTAAEREALS